MRLKPVERIRLAQWVAKWWKYYRDQRYTINDIANMASAKLDMDISPYNLYGAELILGRTACGEQGTELTRRGLPEKQRKKRNQE